MKHVCSFLSVILLGATITKAQDGVTLTAREGVTGISLPAGVSIINGTGTNGTFYNSGSNTPAITGVGIATFGATSAFSIGTNFAGGEGPYIQIDAGKLTNNAEFISSGQMGLMFVSNGVVLGYFDIVPNHGGSVNGAQMGVVTPGNIHLKAASTSALFLNNVGVCLIAANSAGGRTVIGSTAGGKNGESQVLQFQTQGSTASASGENYDTQTPTIWALTNGAGMATLQVYDPAPTWDGVNSNWTGGFPQLVIDTNKTTIASSNSSVMGTLAVARDFTLGSSIDGGGAIHYYNAQNLLELGINTTHAVAFAVQDGGGNSIAVFGSGSGFVNAGNYLNKYGLAIGRDGPAFTPAASSSSTVSNALEVYGHATVVSNMYANSYASLATNRAAITATGYTNIVTSLGAPVNVDVYFKAATATLSDNNGTTLHTFTALTTEDMHVVLKPNWRLVGTSMAGDAVAQ